MILTNQDLSDEQNRRNCVEEFRIARDMAGISSLSQWALKWGDAVCGELNEPSQDHSEEDLAAYRKEADAAQDAHGILMIAVEAEIKRLEELADAHTETSTASAIFSIIENLDKAISE